MIPRIHHLIWLTGAFPAREAAWARTWRELNPGWSDKVWDTRGVLDPPHNLPYVCRKILLNQTLHWVLKTDVARFLMLFYHGGVYSDTDVECCKPMDAFLETSSFAAFSCTPTIIGNAVIGSEPGNPLMLEIAVKMAEKIAVDIAAANANIVDYGVNHAGELLKKVETILPAHYFYPFGSGDRNHCAEEFPESYCIHHWSGMDAGGWYEQTIGKKA